MCAWSLPLCIVCVYMCMLGQNKIIYYSKREAGEMGGIDPIYPLHFVPTLQINKGKLSLGAKQLANKEIKWRHTGGLTEEVS